MKKKASESTWSAVWGMVVLVVTYLPNKLLELVSGPKEKLTSVQRPKLAAVASGPKGKPTSAQRAKPALAKSSARKKAR